MWVTKESGHQSPNQDEEEHGNAGGISAVLIVEQWRGAEVSREGWEAINSTVDSGAVGIVGPKGIVKGLPHVGRNVQEMHVLARGQQHQRCHL